MNRSTPGLPVHHNSQSSLKLTSIESVMPSSHLILCHPLLLLPPIPPSIRVFSNESTLHIGHRLAGRKNNCKCRADALIRSNQNSTPGLFHDLPYNGQSKS